MGGAWGCSSAAGIWVVLDGHGRAGGLQSHGVVDTRFASSRILENVPVKDFWGCYHRIFKKADSQQGKCPNPSYRVLPPPSAGLRGFDAMSMRATGAAGAGNEWRRASHARADPIHPHVCQCGAAGAGQCQLGLLPPAPLLLLAPKAAELAFSQLLRSRTKPL